MIEPWRFNNRKDVSIGDRVFTLLQGKNGPAIIGYGEVAGNPQIVDDSWCVPVQFESLTDPGSEVLLNKQDLLAIKHGQKFWRTQASGIQLDDAVASELEHRVVGNSPKPRDANPTANPDWTRDELILALDFYLAHRPEPPRKESPEIQDLSAILNRLGERLFSVDDRAKTFRNESSVYMKLMNFRRLDPTYTVGGKKGLVRGAKADAEVWTEFGGDPIRCHQVAQAIIASLDDPETDSIAVADFTDSMLEAAEGRLLTRKHIARERNQQLVESKRKQVLRKAGKLACDVCGFNFGDVYGDHGKDFIECHHTKPVSMLEEGHKTRIDDLALVCANCHRMIHRRRPWLSIAELKELVARASVATHWRNDKGFS
ncbi:MAG TPA: HNH endonuclease [Candidatus Acidoferrales bacterium]|nr:HNH endonuclease [Candidatus Acidoferrales bacterium]